MNHLNSCNKLSSRERTELEKYVRFLILKMSQVIVQSRFGEKRKLYTGSKSVFHEWFNLSIEDNSEILIKAKEAYYNIIPLKDFCICIEILLKTADGDILVLETWSLRMSTSDFFCDSPYITYTSLVSVYCRMSLLLKSIIAVSRITPAYKLSTRQSAETYVILFRIYSGEPQVHQLGKNYQENKIGEILTPVGNIKMSLSYRSKDEMTISPKEVDKGPFTIKSNYFEPDAIGQKLSTEGVDKNINMDKIAPVIGAFAPSSHLPNTDYFPELAVLEKPFLHAERSKIKTLKNEDKNKMDAINDNAFINDTAVQESDEKKMDYNCNPSRSEWKNIDRFSNIDRLKKEKKVEPSWEGSKMMLSKTQKKPSFATCDKENDLGEFFLQFQVAPPLVSFQNQPTLEEQLHEVSKNVKMYDDNMAEYDDFVESLDNMEI